MFGKLKNLFGGDSGIEITAPVAGKVVALEDVPDPTFAQGILGPGIAIEPAEGRIVAPADGTVDVMFETGHAVSMTTADGAELLIHVGIDTVQLEGKHYKACCKAGQQVKKGDVLIEFDPAAIKAFLLELAGRLGLTEADLDISDDRDEHDPPREWGMRAEGGNASFLVYMDRDAQVLFTPDEPLPDSIRSLDESSYEAMEQAAAWFVETYANLLDMEDPQICIEGGSYNIYAVQRYSIRIYDRGATAEESTMNYFFRYVTVALNHDDGEILLRYQDTDLSQKLGDYPIISEKEARKMLKNGNSITSTGYTLTGKEEIGRVDIVYRVGPYTVDYLPYYRFLVELPQEHFGHNNGTKTYGAYYVPAVNMAYLPDVTLWNGTFNQ